MIAPAFDAMADKFTDVDYVKLDVDEIHDVAKEFTVTGMPTFVLVKNGTCGALKEVNGYQLFVILRLNRAAICVQWSPKEMRIRVEEGSSMIGVYRRSDGSSSVLTFNGSESRESIDDTKQGHQSLVEWLNETLPYLNLPWEASEEELRACLMDGTVLCNLLNQLSPGSMKMEPFSRVIQK